MHRLVLRLRMTKATAHRFTGLRTELPHSSHVQVLPPRIRACRQPRSRQELWEVVAASGVLRDRGAFDGIYEEACRASGNFGCCSLEGLIKTKTQMVKGALGLPPL
jgi:hypothetical protein